MNNTARRRARTTSEMTETILVTGGAGFIASHVVRMLADKYPQTKVMSEKTPARLIKRTLWHKICTDSNTRSQIIVLDKLDYCSSLKNLEVVRSLLNVTFIKGDIRSVDLLNHIFVSERIDIVLHFAAQSHVDNSFGNSFEFTKNNIEGTHVLLESVRLSRSVIAVRARLYRRSVRGKFV